MTSRLSLPSLLLAVIMCMATAAGGIAPLPDRLAPDDDTTPRHATTPTSDPHETAEMARHAATPPDAPDPAPGYTDDDWFLLSTPRSPTGHVRAFEWQIPDGGVQEIPGGPPLPMMYLEFVPTAATFLPGQDWTLYGFLDDAGSAELMFALTGPTATIEDLNATPPTIEEVPPPSYGVNLLITALNLSDGDRLHFILVGYGATSDDLGFAFRIADASSPEPPAPAPNFTAFLATETGPPVRMPARYDGDGSHDAYYQQRIIPGEDQRRISTDTIRHDSTTVTNLQGTEVVRQEITTRAPSQTGWTLAHVSHQTFTEASYWTVNIAAQQVAGRANGIAMNDPAGATGVVTAAALGAPNALFMADGDRDGDDDGDSHVRLSLDRASAGTATTVQHHQLPDTLETMTGIPSATYAGMYTGHADGLPWIGPLPPT